MKIETARMREWIPDRERAALLALVTQGIQQAKQTPDKSSKNSREIYSQQFYNEFVRGR